MQIYLGNASVVAAGADEDAVESVTVVETPEDATPGDILADVIGLWAAHSDQSPTWVAAEDDDIAKLLAKQFGCTVHAMSTAGRAYDNAAGGQ